MAYSVLQLITRAYYLSGIVATGSQVVTGEQEAIGFAVLNELLASLTVNDVLIPYYTEYTFNTIAGTGGATPYFIPNLLNLDTLTFNVGTVRFPTTQLTRFEFWATGRVDGVTTLPFTFNIQRCKGGSNIYFYPVPNNVYGITIMGKFSLSAVTSPFQDLELSLDDFFIAFLRFNLAKYLCMEYRVTMPAETSKELERLQNNMVNISPPDITMKKDSTLGTGARLTWAMVNFPGWGNVPV